MTATHLTAPGLLAHVFLAADSQDASVGWDRLRSVWDDVTGSFGLFAAISAFDVPARLAPQAAAPPDGYRVLAAAESDADAIWQALAWADHDLLCVTAMMAPSRATDCALAWSSLDRRWGDIVSRLAPAEVIGESRILLALLAGNEAAAGPRGDNATIERTLELVRETMAATQQPSVAGWWRHWDTVRLESAPEPPLGQPPRGFQVIGGLAMLPGQQSVPLGQQVPIWEIGPQTAAGRSARGFIVVAPEVLERQVDHFLWTRGDGLPTALTRHLMHAARLHHQVRVFDEGKASGKLRGELGRLVDDVSSQWAAEGDPASRSADRDRLLASLARSQAVAIALRARMGAMRIAVGVIDQSMGRSVGLMATDVAVGPLSADRQLTTWLYRRLGDEIAMLDSATENAQRVTSLPVPVATVLARGGTPLAGGHPRAPDGPEPPAALPDRSPARRSVGSPVPWVVILTALSVEYEAIKEYLGGRVRSRAESGTLYEMGELPAGAHGSWQVAIAQTGPGSATAGVQLERAIRVFQPQIALFIGVAGGRKDVSHGDVVVADRIYDYETGKAEMERFLPRMRTYQSTYRLVQQAQLVARQGRWHQRIRPECPQPPPKAFVKPIATGAKVVADDKSEIALLLDRNASDALAVETEGHGFLEGAYMNPGVEALVIRGISDLLTGKDQTADERWQPIASAHAAAFAVELLDTLGMTAT